MSHLSTLLFLLLPCFSSAICKKWCETASDTWDNKCYWVNCNTCDKCCSDDDACNPTTAPTVAPTQVYCTSVDACSGFTESWRDDFDSFDTQSWSKGLWGPNAGNKKTGGSGLLNDKYAGWIRDEDSYVLNGSLFLANTDTVVNGTTGEGDKMFNYTSGWINSKHKRFWNGTAKSSYLDIRAKFPAGPKTWPAIWMVANGGGWPPEIDIWEYFGVFFNPNWGCTDCMYMRNIYGDDWRDKEDLSLIIEDFHSAYPTAEAAFHQYGWLWTNSVMAWYIDGTEVAKMTIDVDISAEDWPSEDMMLIMNNGLLSAITTEKYPELDETLFPNFLVIDSLVLYEETLSDDDDFNTDDSVSESESTISMASSMIVAAGMVGGLTILGGGMLAYKKMTSWASLEHTEESSDPTINPISEKDITPINAITNNKL